MKVTYSETPYKPIACSFYDIIETAAVKKSDINITYLNNGEITERVNVQITSINSKNKAEYITLSDNTEVRLDKILTINGVVLRNNC